MRILSHITAVEFIAAVSTVVSAVTSLTDVHTTAVFAAKLRRRASFTTTQTHLVANFQYRRLKTTKHPNYIVTQSRM